MHAGNTNTLELGRLLPLWLVHIGHDGAGMAREHVDIRLEGRVFVVLD
jgi:hypothetical protein